MALQRHFIPYSLSICQRMFLIPYFGFGALRNPERGDLVAGLGDVTAEIALESLHKKMTQSEEGRWLLQNKPLITEELLDMNKLRRLPSSTMGRQYANYMDSNKFSPNERSTVRYMTNAENAYVMTRYRQVHDFWHVLSGLPPTVLGELALKWFEFYITGLPVCLLSGTVGTLKLSTLEQHKLRITFEPWARSNAKSCGDLLSFHYEKYLETDVEEVRKILQFEKAPVI